MSDIDETKYKVFFEKMRAFKVRQSEQKMRGINDFNILSVVRSKYAEVGLHSQFIYELINVNGLHYQGEIFLNLFIKHVLLIEQEKFGQVTKEMREDPTKDGRRIDFSIESSKYLIGIEMKIFAPDLNEQIYSYYHELLSRKASSEDAREVKIYYLSLNAKEASLESRKEKDFKYERISFKEHIIKWMNACIEEISNITNLSVQLSQYRDVVLQITNQYKGKVMTLEDALKSKEEYEIAMEISKNLLAIRQKVVSNFINELIENLRIELGEEWEFEMKSDYEKSWKVAIRIYKKSWKNIGKKMYYFSFWFAESDYHNAEIIVVKNDDSIKNKEIYEKFSKQLSDIKIQSNPADWSFWREKLDKGDFAEQVLYKDLEIERVSKKFKDCVDQFERNTNLLTDVNTYINSNP